MCQLCRLADKEIIPIKDEVVYCWQCDNAINMNDKPFKFFVRDTTQQKYPIRIVGLVETGFFCETCYSTESYAFVLCNSYRLYEVYKRNIQSAIPKHIWDGLPDVDFNIRSITPLPIFEEVPGLLYDRGLFISSQYSYNHIHVLYDALERVRGLVCINQIYYVE